MGWRTVSRYQYQRLRTAKEYAPPERVLCVYRFTRAEGWTAFASVLVPGWRWCGPLWLELLEAWRSETIAVSWIGCSTPRAFYNIQLDVQHRYSYLNHRADGFLDRRVGGPMATDADGHLAPDLLPLLTPEPWERVFEFSDAGRVFFDLLSDLDWANGGPAGREWERLEELKAQLSDGERTGILNTLMRERRR